MSVAITARRSRLHPGTRYLARGLNGAYSTGKLPFDINSVFDCNLKPLLIVNGLIVD